MNQQTLFLEPRDPSSRKHGGNAQSVAAYARVDVKTQVQRILEVLEKGDFTFEEIAARMGTLPHKISGRALSMRNDGLIEKVGERRGAAVYRKCR